MEILELANEVREWGEKFQAINSRHYHSSLAGLCLICSYKLRNRLVEYNYKPKLCLTSGHAFLKIDDKILDITATQFDRDRIVFAPVTEFQNWYYQSEYELDDLTELENLVEEWTDSQNPFKLHKVEGIVHVD